MEIKVLLTQVFVIWMMVAGLAYMVSGPRGANAVLRWPAVKALRMMRHATGGIIISFGSWIHGDKKKPSKKRGRVR